MSKQTAVKINQGEYLLYPDGRLFNMKNKNWKKWTKDSNGYMKCTIWYMGKPISITQHRLLAEMFISNPNNKEQVNHINGIKNDNRLENLEWVTQSENAIHSFKNGLQKPTRPNMKKVIHIESNFIYDSISDAARANGIGIGHLNNMLNKRNKNTSKLRLYEKN